MKRAFLVLGATLLSAVSAADTLAIDPSETAAISSRLIGQRFTLTADRLTIDDIAGEGAPLIGVIEARGDQAWLLRDGAPAVRITGPLARPRIAGPGYTVWVLPAAAPAADGSIRARRLGVLRRRR